MVAVKLFLKRRNWEALLLLLAAAVLIVGLAAVSFARGEPFHGWRRLFAVLVIGAWYAQHIAMRLFRPDADQVLLPLVAVLSALGVVSVESLAPGLVAREQLNLVVAICLMAGIAFGLRDVRWLSLHKYSAGALAIVLLIMTTLFGHKVGHAQLSLRVASVGFQPT